MKPLPNPGRFNRDDGIVSVKLDRDSGVRQLPRRYLDEGHVAYGYALTAHKAQGITTDRTFTVVTSATDREWIYVALSRGRSANTLYITTCEPTDPECTHIFHRDERDVVAVSGSRIGRSSAQVAAIDQRPLAAGISLGG
ncbi:MAG: helicase C-terminal domain-containing protein [Acidimicrobiia bacterium]|nr:MAG: helicase C-terminal domain-containing protein [Acidimicrobiia bacterium]